MPDACTDAVFHAGEAIGSHTVYRRSGHGVPVLLLNGCGLSSRGWHLLLDHLGGRTVLLVDRPGIGSTPWPGRLPTLAGEAAALARIITEPVIVVAHSMAAFHAEAFARLHPHLVSGVVLVDPSIEPRPRRWPTPIRSASWLAGLALRMQIMRRAASSVLGWTTQRQAAHPERLTDWAWRQPYRTRDALAAGASEWLSYQRQASDLAALRNDRPLEPVPVTVLTADGAIDDRRLAFLRGALGPFVHERHADVGHLMMIDCPEVIAAAIARHDSARPGRPDNAGEIP